MHGRRSADGATFRRSGRCVFRAGRSSPAPTSYSLANLKPASMSALSGRAALFMALLQHRTMERLSCAMGVSNLVRRSGGLPRLSLFIPFTRRYCPCCFW